MTVGMGVECGNIIYLDKKLTYFVEKFITIALQ